MSCSLDLSVSKLQLQVCAAFPCPGGSHVACLHWVVKCAGVPPGNCGPIRIDINLEKLVNAVWLEVDHQCIDLGYPQCGGSIIDNKNALFTYHPNFGVHGPEPDVPYRVLANMYKSQCSLDSGDPVITADTLNIMYEPSRWFLN